MKKLIFSALVATAVCISSCSKDGDGGGGSGSGLPGTLYVDFATDGIQSYNFSNGKLSRVIKTMNGAGITGCDITYGSSEIAISVGIVPLSVGVVQDTQTFLLRPWDGKNAQFSYKEVPQTGNIFSFTWTHPTKSFYKESIIRISPNKKYIAVDSNYWEERGVLLFNTQTGKLIADFTNGTRDDLSYQSTPVWTENNEMYSAIRGVLYRWKEAYGDLVEEVLTLNEGKGASDVTVNPQGTRVAFRYKKHLWVQNIDGSDLHQVTTSEIKDFKYEGEYHPVFSPDGKYIALVGSARIGGSWTDYDPLQPRFGGTVVVGNGYGYVFVIRDDGKLYDLENDKSGFIVLRKEGEKSGVPSYFSGMMWR